MGQLIVETACKMSILEGVKATLSDLHHDTANIVRPVIHGGKKVTLTDRGQDCAQIVPLPRIDRRAALEALRSIGPVDLPPRK